MAGIILAALCIFLFLAPCIVGGLLLEWIWIHSKILTIIFYIGILVMLGNIVAQLA